MKPVPREPRRQRSPDRPGSGRPGRRRWGVFLDRDGTLLHLVPYLRDPAEARLYHGVGGALRDLRAAGARLVVITNQAGVARGLMSKNDVRLLHARLKTLLAGEGVRLDAIEVCFDHPDYTRECDCRKPRPGMLLRAAEKLGIDLGKSWTVGDNVSDIEAGRAAGTRTALVLTGYGRKTRQTSTGATADIVAANLRGVVREILKLSGAGRQAF